MNEKLKPLLSLIAIACGLIFIVLIVASFVISSTEEIDLTRLEHDYTYMPYFIAVMGIGMIIVTFFTYRRKEKV